jgi:hypothetical protein
MAAWLLSFPLMIAGSQVAHVLAYRWVYPNAHVRLGELLATGHSYMGSPAYLPMLLGLAFAAELVGVGWVLAGSVRRSLQRPVPAWTFALLPILGFTLQEFLERLLADGSFPWWMVLQPTFRAGLLIQLPFALIGYLLARLLLHVADRVGSALRPGVARPAMVGIALGWVLVEVSSPRRHVLGAGYASRGPPLGAHAVTALAR